MFNHKIFLLSIFAIVSVFGFDASAQMKMPAFFSDNAVLQRDMPVPVWGKAEPGANVNVSFRGQAKSVKAGTDGKWMIRLDPMKADASPADMTISSPESKTEPKSITLKGLLIGEVWFCSGQSNMQFPLKNALNGEKEVSEANYPLIRLFTVKPVVKGVPQDDVVPEWKTWQVCSPQTVKEFSAVAYLFGRDIQKALGNIPVGLINSSCGWTPAESWTPRDAMSADPDLKCIVTRWDEAVAKAEAWQKECDASKAAGKPKPEKPKDIVDPNFIHRASGLYNASVHPCIPFAIRGVLWYQGETNDNRGIQYRKLFPALINSWRKNWGQGDFPFIFAQLANVLPPPDYAKDPIWFDSEWSEVREAQNLTLDKVPKTGMAVTIDIGEEKDVHPKNKQEAGRRLALAARAVAYGEKIPFSGPRYEKISVEDGKIRVHFQNTEGGLATSDDKEPNWFYIAGNDRKWERAQAKIDGKTVLVWSDQVKDPVSVRYAWANNPFGCNLCNKADGKIFLPCGPFRSDDWPGKSTGATKMYMDQQ